MHLAATLLLIVKVECPNAQNARMGICVDSPLPVVGLGQPRTQAHTRKLEEGLVRLGKIPSQHNCVSDYVPYS